MDVSLEKKIMGGSSIIEKLRGKKKKRDSEKTLRAGSVIIIQKDFLVEQDTIGPQPR